ncbi:hypothetical protein H8356DRAFT_1629126 [Neocallimastix lanati (nom. inval.)]|uniref:Uncharacterized protein n=1 Tax=Neocallimastix californiae TaxID=1754190 RepID=A0A1Y2F6R5_9FUNG|nr:hypothetical protein H8356DRAFT_1629126 [Neocallimastix sp. JGI-2020a]ORY79571.1 hypothetical protein LY90DRAFT_664639 [Neocallimastix californiae]|eukprot:ORY79571.1 hypothetical protein LY90DRAFT_664639 [Neocallimastix californiae]
MSDLIFLNKIPKISSKIYRIVNKYKDLLIKDDNKRDKQVLSKLIEDYYEYVYELLFFLCRVKNAGYLKNEEVQNFVDKYIMPKINNDIFTNQNDNDSSKKELKYYLKKFFIKNSEKFKASEHLNNTEFNIKMENLMEYINREYDLKI